MNTAGIFHNPDGKVITGTLQGANIVFNIANTYSVTGDFIQQQLSGPTSGTEPIVLSRKIKNSQPLKMQQDSETGLQVVYSLKPARPAETQQAPVRRPRTQEAGRRETTRRAGKSKDPPATVHLLARAKRVIRGDNGRTKKGASAKPHEAKGIASAQKAKSRPPAKTLKLKQQQQNTASKCEEKSRKTGPVPHSGNRFKGKYREVVPVQFKMKKEQLEKERQQQDVEAGAKKKLKEKVKKESESIRAQNFYLLRCPLEDNYVDPEAKRKEEERRREKEEAERRRVEFKAKLERRKKEMGLEFIDNIPLEERSIPKFKEVIEQERILKMQPKIKTKPGSANKRRYRLKRNLFNNEQIRAMVQTSQSQQPVKDYRIEKPSPEEKQKRKELVAEHFKMGRLRREEQLQAKAEVEEAKRERLKQLELRRRELEGANKGSSSAVKKQKPVRKRRRGSMADSELTLTQLQEWIMEEVGESELMFQARARSHHALKREIDQIIEMSIPNAVEKPAVNAKPQPEPDEEAQVLYSKKPGRLRLQEAQRENASRKAQQIRDQQQSAAASGNTGAVKAKLLMGREEQKAMHQQMGDICERLKVIALNQERMRQAAQINTQPTQTIPQSQPQPGPHPGPQPERIEESPAVNEKQTQKPKPQAVVKNNWIQPEDDPEKIPGVVNIHAHYSKLKTRDRNQDRKAATEIQKHVRGFMARRGVKQLRQELESIDEQFAYYSRTPERTTAQQDYPQIPDRYIHSPLELKDNDPLSIVNVFINQNRELLEREMKSEQEVDEDIVGATKKIIEGTPTIKSKREAKKRAAAYTSNKKSVESITESIPEDMESIRSSVRKSASRHEAKETSYVSERIVEEEEEEKEAERNRTEEAGSIPEDCDPSSVAKATRRDDPVVAQRPDENVNHDNRLLDKFIEVTKALQQQHNEQIHEVIDKLCQHLKHIKAEAIVQIAPEQFAFAGQPATVQRTPAIHPMQAMQSMQAAGRREEETGYEPDFEEESHVLPPVKPRTPKERSEILEESIKEEIGLSPSRSEGPDVVEEEVPEEISKGTPTVRGPVEEEIEEVVVTDEESSMKEEKKVVASVASSPSTERAERAERAARAERAEKIARDRTAKLFEAENDDSKGEESITESMLDRNSFSELAFTKFREVLQSSKVDSILKLREDGLRLKYEQKMRELGEQLSSKAISATASQKRKREIESWYRNERKTLAAEKKNQVVSAMKQCILTMEQIEKDKERTKRLMDVRQPREEEISRDTIRTESIGEIPELTKELEELSKYKPQQTSDQRRKEIVQKRLAAEKLLTEKQKVIDEGVKDRILKSEEEEAEMLFKVAQQIDVTSEIESRVKAADVMRKAKQQNAQRRPEMVPMPSRPLPAKPLPVTESIQESIQEEIGESLAGSVDQMVKGRDVARPVAGTLEESIKEEMGGVETRNMSIKEEMEESKQRVSMSRGQYEEYSMSFEQESQADMRKRTGEAQLARQTSLEESLSDSQKKIYMSSEDSEAFSGSGIDWVLSLDHPPSAPRSVVLQEREAKKEGKKLTSVQELRSDDEESRAEKPEIKKAEVDAIDSDIAESYENEEYPEDFENPSGSKTPREIKGRTVEPDSPFTSSIEISAESKKEQASGSNSANFKISLERIAKAEEEKKITEDEIKEMENEYLAESIQESIRESGVQESLEESQHKSQDLLRSSEEGRREALRKKFLTQEEIDRIEAERLREEEEKQLKKIADAYNRKREEENKKKTEQMTDQIFQDVLGELKDHLFPDRSEERMVPEQKVVETTPREIQVREEVKGEKRYISGIRTTLQHVEHYVEEVFSAIRSNPDKFIESLSQPLNKDPLLIMGQIQNEDMDYYSSQDPVVTQPVMPVDLYLEIERGRRVQMIAEKADDIQHESLLTEWSNIHNKCIFDTINDALDCYRPYGVRGPPLPWSRKVRELTFRNGSVSSIDEILSAVKTKVMSWAIINAGTLALPVDKEGASAQSIDRPITSEKIKLDQCREERLTAMLSIEVNESEFQWVDYENEETQVLLDMADMILETLVNESAQIVTHIEEARIHSQHH